MYKQQQNKRSMRVLKHLERNLNVMLVSADTRARKMLVLFVLSYTFEIKFVGL